MNYQSLLWQRMPSSSHRRHSVNHAVWRLHVADGDDEGRLAGGVARAKA